VTRNVILFTDLADIGYSSRGSDFLKRWMDFLEQNADLRYPDISTLSGDT
jgi:DNA polymerase alpha-associated DNA helicase A